MFGFGCVGQGLYHVLNNSTGFKADIEKIVVKNKNKERSIAKELIVFDKEEVLNNPQIDVVVELIDDPHEAFSIVSEALKKGKHVVTANKKMGGTTPEFETTYFWLYPFVEKDYRLFNPDFSRTTMINNKELFYIISYFDGIYKYT